jgi:solute carrier family 25 S-adenosylmethionine transporter 26
MHTTGAVTGFLTTPLDLIKTKLMMQSATGSPGIVSAFKAVYREGGTAALFTGATARVAWLLPFTTIYLGIYEGLKKGILAIKQAKLDAEV